MLDTSKPIENPQLSHALEQLHRENTPERQKEVLDLIVTDAHFLAPVAFAPASAPEINAREMPEVSVMELAEQEAQVNLYNQE